MFIFERVIKRLSIFFFLFLAINVKGNESGQDSGKRPILIIEMGINMAYQHLKDSSKVFTFGCGNESIHKEDKNLAHYLALTDSYLLLETLLDSANIYGQMYAAYELLNLDVDNEYELSEEVISKIKAIFKKSQKIRYCAGCFLYIKPVPWVARKHGFYKLLKTAIRK